MNAIELLKTQHREVESLFQRCKTAQTDEKISVLGKVCEALTLHATLEELYFYPLLSENNLEEDRGRSQQEHQEAKQLISQVLQAKQTDPNLDQLLLQLESSVLAHVQEEERAVFPRLQQAIDEQQLIRVGTEMSQAIGRLQQQELLALAENQQSPVAP
ncbi:MAG TPA: hemerythrin domain-containing protein [Myxococcaceae bacterium]|nr:hemerythrin domain-containing protein [Myxococcaceae bacterium]